MKGGKVLPTKKVFMQSRQTRKITVHIFNQQLPTTPPTGRGSCNCATPKDNIIDGVGGTGNTNGNWWDYGTGYPYFPWNPGGGIIGGGPTEPDWS